jgi:hypothetical protein
LALQEGMAIHRGIRKVQHRSACMAYHADSVTDGTIGGKFIQNGDGTFDRFRDSTVTSSRSGEGLCLYLEYILDGLEGVALLEFLGKWVLCPWFSRLFCVLLEGRLEEGGKIRGLGF